MYIQIFSNKFDLKQTIRVLHKNYKIQIIDFRQLRSKNSASSDSSIVLEHHSKVNGLSPTGKILFLKTRKKCHYNNGYYTGLGYLKVVLSRLGGATVSILLFSASMLVTANTFDIACVLVTAYMLSTGSTLYIAIY